VTDSFVPVAKVADVPPNSTLMVVLDNREIGLFNVDGTIYALDNTCPHSGAALTDGWVDAQTVTCPWHAWCFRLTDGKMTLGYAQVDAFDVRIEDGDVLVNRVPKRLEPA
jgi:nitrite reductase/ring-hydroxylating ferredoxin subunit